MVFTGCVDLVLRSIVALDAAPITEVRISGVGFLSLDQKDSADQATAQDGFLCVRHGPGCGIVGNSGTDQFFGSGKPLPLLAQIVGVDYAPASPSVPGGLGGWGSSGSDARPGSADGQTATTVGWSNACQGARAGKDLYYSMSFRVRIRGDVSQLNEPAFATSYKAPACGDAPDQTMPPFPMASGLLGVVKYCNPSTQKASGTLILKGACSPAQSGSPFACDMNESIPITFAGAQGIKPSESNFMTRQIYQPGGWTLSTMQVQGLTGPLQSQPLSLQLPGGPGSPVLDFSGGACR